MRILQIMKLHSIFLTPFLSAALLTPLAARDAASVHDAAALRSTVEYLASPELEGRATGSDGARKAAGYLAAELQKAGIAPGGDNGTYFQEFEFTDGVKVDAAGCALSVKGREEMVFEVEKAFRPLAFSGSGSVEGEVVFAGYGLRTPGEGAHAYDSYAGLDVKDKIVVVFRYVPEGVSQQRRAELNRYSGLRYKALIAREHGAKGLLVVTGPNSPNAGELVSIETDAGNTGSDILAASISQEAAEALFAQVGKKLKEVQGQLDQENPHAERGFIIPDTTVELSTAVERVRRKDRNVIGILPPTGRFATQPEYVAAGGHYDHLGHGESGNSMQRKGEEHGIHYGADDNASGTALVLALAKREATVRKGQPERDARGVIVAFWSGEEIGIIGSSHFGEKPAVPMESIVAYLNFDMVGRLRDNKLSVQGVGSSADWKRLVEKRNVAAGFNLTLQEDPYLPTDSTAFYPKGVPVLCFFTGAHEDYHRPTDTADRLNYEGLARITRFAGAIINDLMLMDERPAYVKVERSQMPGGGSRDKLRATIGTIPDYAAEVNGVKLSGVRGGAPADKAGLQGGDVIVGFAGQKISNIYDYTYALDAVKVGVAVAIVVERDGKRVELTVTPEGRK